MDHEGERPAAALGLRAAAIAALGRFLAEGRRPGQRQDVKIKLARGVLPAVLRGRRPGAETSDQQTASETRSREIN